MYILFLYLYCIYMYQFYVLSNVLILDIHGYFWSLPIQYQPFSDLCGRHCLQRVLGNTERRHFKWLFFLWRSGLLSESKGLQCQSYATSEQAWKSGHQPHVSCNKARPHSSMHAYHPPTALKHVCVWENREKASALGHFQMAC